MKNNKEQWKNYVETDENKLLYKEKNQIEIQEVDNENSNSDNDEKSK